MKLAQLFEASDEAKKYIDRDGKSIRRLPRKEEPITPANIQKPKQSKFSVGQKVEYVANGKVSKYEGMAGKKVTGTIMQIHNEDDMLSVLPDYRTQTGAMNPDMQAVVQMSDATIVTAEKMKDEWSIPSKEELYGKCGYDKRIKRLGKDERMDPDFIGSVLRFAHEKNGKLYYMGSNGERDPNPMAEIAVVGTTYKQNPMHGTWHKAQTLELRFHNGSIIPATRLSPTHVISQDYRFKAYMPSGVAKFWSIIRDHNHR